MASAHRSSIATVTGSNGITSLAANMPAGVVAGDLLVAVVVNGSTAAPVHTTPSGWTLVGSNNDGGGGGYVTTSVYKRVAGGSEPSTYTFTSSESASARLSVLIHAMQDTADIDAASFLPQATSSTSRPTSSITLAEERTVLAVFSGRNAESWTDPAGTTRLAVSTSNTSVVTVSARHAAGSVSYTATASAASSTGVTVILALTDSITSDPPTIVVDQPADNIVDLRDSADGDGSSLTFLSPVRVSGPTLTSSALADGLWLFEQDPGGDSLYTFTVRQGDLQTDSESVVIPQKATGSGSNVVILTMVGGVLA